MNRHNLFQVLGFVGWNRRFVAVRPSHLRDEEGRRCSEAPRCGRRSPECGPRAQVPGGTAPSLACGPARHETMVALCGTRRRQWRWQGRAVLPAAREVHGRQGRRRWDARVPPSRRCACSRAPQDTSAGRRKRDRHRLRRPRARFQRPSSWPRCPGPGTEGLGPREDGIQLPGSFAL